MTDVDSAEIPIFVDEKVDDVDCVKNINNDDRVCDVAEFLVLVGGEGKITNQMVSITSAGSDPLRRRSRWRSGVTRDLRSVAKNAPTEPTSRTPRFPSSPQLRGKGYSHQRPRHNPRPSIMKQLKIKPLPNPGVELNPHIEIIHQAPRKLPIF